jgi:tetratricopeptide (TPR) repeat protein
LPEAWTGQALLNELHGEELRMEEARMLYASVAAVRADLQEANLGLGRTAIACGDEFQAEMGLLRALDRDPSNVDAQYMLALAFERQGRLEMAMDVLSRIVFVPQKGKASNTSIQSVVLKEFESWPLERKQRAVQASAGRIAAELGSFEESVKLLSGLETPLLWHELATTAYALLKLGKAEEAIK